MISLVKKNLGKVPERVFITDVVDLKLPPCNFKFFDFTRQVDTLTNSQIVPFRME